MAVGGCARDGCLPYCFDVSMLDYITQPDLREHITRVGVVFVSKDTIARVSEAECRAELIDPALKAAGRGVVPSSRIADKQ